MRRLAPTLVLVLPLLACDGLVAGDEAAQEEFTLLDAMIQIDLAYQAIEPHIRDSSRLEETRADAEAIVAWADDPTFESFLAGDRFYSDPERFRAMRDDMRAGAQRVADGATAGDLDEVRAGFIDMKMSCIACHKRYSPSY